MPFFSRSKPKKHQPHQAKPGQIAPGGYGYPHLPPQTQGVVGIGQTSVPTKEEPIHSSYAPPIPPNKPCSGSWQPSYQQPGQYQYNQHVQSSANLTAHQVYAHHQNNSSTWLPDQQQSGFNPYATVQPVQQPPQRPAPLLRPHTSAGTSVPIVHDVPLPVQQSLQTPVHCLKPKTSLTNLAWKSCTNLAEAYADKTSSYLGKTLALYDVLSSKLNDVITLIDDDAFGGTESELVVTYLPPPELVPVGQESLPTTQDRRLKKTKDSEAASKSKGIAQNYFAKASLYSNSHLPSDLPPLKLYIPTYPLLCLAAQYSLNAYMQPTGPESSTHVSSNWRSGTKAMIIKSVPVDDMNTVVLAVRGSSTLADWTVNLNAAPSSPVGLLDDEGNLCHAGFLSVARKMLDPIAARLRHLLAENPDRSHCSLLITGHSAGGAVAALLYAHMLSNTAAVVSPLKQLANCFKRIHCVTWGAPPLSLLPIAKPETYVTRKSVFLAFINEGDPVVRADKAYIKSLLELYSSAGPKVKDRKEKKQHLRPGVVSWTLPPSTLCVAGRPVILRPKPTHHHTGHHLTSHKPSSNTIITHTNNNKPSPLLTKFIASAKLASKSSPPSSSLQDNRKTNNAPIEAVITTDEELRTVVYGDPVMHMMRVYEERIKSVAYRAVVGG